jgi:hypothetical protein
MKHIIYILSFAILLGSSVAAQTSADSVSMNVTMKVRTLLYVVNMGLNDEVVLGKFAKRGALVTDTTTGLTNVVVPLTPAEYVAIVYAVGMQPAFYASQPLDDLLDAVANLRQTRPWLHEQLLAMTENGVENRRRAMRRASDRAKKMAQAWGY